MDVTIKLSDENINAIAVRVVEIQNKENNKPATESKSNLFTVKQVAAWTKKTENTIARHIRDKILKADKVGKSWLINEENFNKYINNEE